MAHPMFVKHQDLLGSAVHAIGSRGGWRPYADDLAAYGAHAVEQGRQAFFEAYPDAQFYLDQPGVVGRGGGEVSPWGIALNVSYPKCSADALIAAAKTAMPAWAKAGPDVRAAVCAEILAGLNARSIEIGYATMHTTGQSFRRAFLYGGPRAQERGLEAVAYAWREMKHVPYRATWETAGGKPQRLEKRYVVAPRGVALVYPCATAPTWSSYPGIFASLATGNAVIVKPHPEAILPLAITVAHMRQTLKETGFDSNLVSLLVDTDAAPVARDVALKPDVRVIDYAGEPAFGKWLEENARQALVFTEKSAVGCIAVHGTDDYAGMLDDVALALAPDSGQVRGAPHVLLVARQGVHTPDGNVPVERFCADLAAAIGRLLQDHGRAVEMLGALRSRDTVKRMQTLADAADVETVRASEPIVAEEWPDATLRTPLLLRVPPERSELWMEEVDGPVGFVVETATAAESLAFAERAMREKGALMFSVYSDNEHIVQLAEEVALRSGTALAVNLVGSGDFAYSAAFSDYRGSGANPAARGCLTDGGFVSGRFVVVQSCRKG